ncbi:MAG: hypothetical protein M3O71_10605 [Bacteroidota bacterium]|nr:hypothetical protein [Bacteroidota bacterium]
MQNRTEAILEQFANSWIETENFFDRLIENYPGFDRLKPIRKFIEELRQNDGHLYFRIGSSMHDLLISRSVKHGMRTDQKYIKIETYDEKFAITLRDGEKTYREYMVENLNDYRVTNLIKTLKNTLVD